MRNMQWFLSSAALLLLAACSDASMPAEPFEDPIEPEPVTGLAPLYMAAPGAEARDGQYIVVLRQGAAAAPTGAAVSEAHQVKPSYVYTEALNGFAAQLTDAQVEALRRDPAVAYVEQNQVMRATYSQRIPANGQWGLDRIDQRNRGLTGRYMYNNTGQGVYAYVIDTGIEPDHPQFRTSSGGTRARVHSDFMGDGRRGIDCDGHGTHVAGILGGGTFGVAKRVNLRAVRVLDCDGNGTTATVVAGIDAVRGSHTKPAVANLSLGGGFSKATNQAVDALHRAGVLVVVAAGNDDAYSCEASPASAVRALAVAATDSADARWEDSGWGRCVTMYAPGEDILSSYLNGTTARGSGTSAAAPHVAGVAALYLQTHPTASPTGVRDWLVTNSTSGRVREVDLGGLQYGTPNRLLYKGGL